MPSDNIFPQVKIFTGIAIDSTGKGLIGELPGISSYKQSYRANLGYYTCQILVEDRPRDELIDMFYTLLGTHVRCVFGGSTVWEGVIYDTVLHSGSISRTRTFDEMANSVKVTYINTSGNLQTSSVAQQSQSIATYGRKEEIVTMDSFDQTPAEQRRDQLLKENAWPRTIATGTNFQAEDALEIMACGYGWTLNWRYTTTADDSTSTVNTWITDILDTDVELVSKGKIDANTMAVKQTVSSPSRCWDLIEQLTQLGDSSGNFYQSYVDDQRRFYYRQISKDPGYQISQGEIYALGGSTVKHDPWSVRPAVFRDLDYISAPAEPDIYYDDARDFFVEEVEVSTGGIVALKTTDFDEVELLATQQEYQHRQEQQATPGGNQMSRGSKERLNWKRKIGLPQKDWKRWEKMSASERWKFRKEKIAEWKSSKKSSKKKKK